jgi:histidinol dehydrogenase
LSLGINLFPGRKCCQFDCPYCEVFPFSANAEFSLEQMENDLRLVIAGVTLGEASRAEGRNVKIKDICFSGNGEPTLSPAFGEALAKAEKIREETAPSAQLVVITNGAGLLQPEVFSVLKKAACNPAFNIWLKLDAGTPGWYEKMNRCSIPFGTLTAKIKEFIISAGMSAPKSAPVTIQTMLCAINGEAPPEEEERSWINFLLEAAGSAAAVGKVHIYGKARPAPEDPLASALPAEFLERRAESLRRAFADRSVNISVETYL